MRKSAAEGVCPELLCLGKFRAAFAGRLVRKRGMRKAGRVDRMDLRWLGQGGLGAEMQKEKGGLGGLGVAGRAWCGREWGGRARGTGQTGGVGGRSEGGMK